MQDSNDDIHRELTRLSRLFGSAAGPEWKPLHYAKQCNVAFMLEIDQREFHFKVRDGGVESVSIGPLLMRSWQFAIRAPELCWRRFWSELPAPGYNDIFAMTSYGHARIDGDMGPLLNDLRFIKTLIALPRGRLDSEVK